MPSTTPSTPLALLAFSTLALGGLLASASCGTEIGDSCSFSSECSPTGDRICASGVGLPNGYCTVFGCDYDTCPDESVCVGFFAVSSTNLFCNPVSEDAPTTTLDDGTTVLAHSNGEPILDGAGDYIRNPDGAPAVPTDDCAPDDTCTQSGSCAPRSAETRYCMRKCSDDDGCRDGYHCRNYSLMLQYGGEIVTPPGSNLGQVQPFCAAAPPEDEIEETDE